MIPTLHRWRSKLVLPNWNETKSELVDEIPDKLVRLPATSDLDHLAAEQALLDMDDTDAAEQYPLTSKRGSFMGRILSPHKNSTSGRMQPTTSPLKKLTASPRPASFVLSPKKASPMLTSRQVGCMHVREFMPHRTF